jgi:Domain of unknown function (DUF4911)
MRPWQAKSHECFRYTARVEPHEIGYLCSIVEGHEGLAIVRTNDEALGIVEFWVAPPMQRDFEEFLAGLGKEMTITHGEPVAIDVSILGDP